MSEENKQKPQDHPIIKEFIVNYLNAMEDVEAAKQTTDTPAWQTIYGEQMKEAVKTRHRIHDQLEQRAETLKEDGWSEDDEKAVKDLVKSAVELRIGAEHFKRAVVTPLKLPVDKAHMVWDTAKSRAQNFAVESPMFGTDVRDELHRVYESMPKASFSDTTGTIAIKTDDKASGEVAA